MILIVGFFLTDFLFSCFLFFSRRSFISPMTVLVPTLTHAHTHTDTDKRYTYTEIGAETERQRDRDER